MVDGGWWLVVIMKSTQRTAASSNTITLPPTPLRDCQDDDRVAAVIQSVTRTHTNTNSNLADVCVSI